MPQLGVTIPSTHHTTNPFLVVLGSRNTKLVPTESTSLESRSYSLDKEILQNSGEQKRFLKKYSILLLGVRSILHGTHTLDLLKYHMQ